MELKVILGESREDFKQDVKLRERIKQNIKNYIKDELMNSLIIICYNLALVLSFLYLNF